MYKKQKTKNTNIYKNMNCGTYTECKIRNWVFENNLGFLKLSKIFRKIRFFRKCFGFFGVFVKQIVFLVSDSDSVY